jgi:conjugal transfer/entry exclusion protein
LTMSCRKRWLHSLPVSPETPTEARLATGAHSTYAKHIQEMEEDLLQQQGDMEATMAERESVRTAEVDAMAATQVALEKEISDAKRVCDTVEGSLRQATAREADLTRDFTEATQAIQAAQAQIAKREEEKSKAQVRPTA